MASPESPSKRCPVDLRRIMEETVHQIAQGVRLPRTGLSESDSGIEDLSNDSTIEDALLSQIEEFFINHDINENISYLHEKKENATSKDPAWRPTTGTVDTISLEVAALLHKKRLLKQRLRKIKPRTKELEQKLLDSKAEMEEVTEKMYKLMRDN